MDASIFLFLLPSRYLTKEEEVNVLRCFKSLKKCISISSISIFKITFEDIRFLQFFIKEAARKWGPLIKVRRMSTDYLKFFFWLKKINKKNKSKNSRERSL